MFAAHTAQHGRDFWVSGGIGLAGLAMMEGNATQASIQGCYPHLGCQCANVPQDGFRCRGQGAPLMLRTPGGELLPIAGIGVSRVRGIAVSGVRLGVGQRGRKIGHGVSPTVIIHAAAQFG